MWLGMKAVTSVGIEKKCECEYVYIYIFLIIYIYNTYTHSIFLKDLSHSQR